MAQLLAKSRLSIDIEVSLQNALVDPGQERYCGHAWIGRRSRVRWGILLNDFDQLVEHLNGSEVSHIHAIRKIGGGEIAATTRPYRQVYFIDAKSLVRQ